MDYLNIIMWFLLGVAFTWCIVLNTNRKPRVKLVKARIISKNFKYLSITQLSLDEGIEKTCWVYVLYDEHITNSILKIYVSQEYYRSIKVGDIITITV